MSYFILQWELEISIASNNYLVEITPEDRNGLWKEELDYEKSNIDANLSLLPE